MKYFFGVALCAALMSAGCTSQRDIPRRAPLPARAHVSRAPTAQPPAGLSARDVPQFVILTFDDDRAACYGPQKCDGGVRWSLDFLRDLKNPAGSGEAGTFDSEPVRATYFVVGQYLDRTKNQFSPALRHAMKLMREEGHEIASHSFSHARELRDIKDPLSWDREIGRVHDLFFRADIDLLLLNRFFRSGGIGMKPEEMQGFRMPYLAYTQEQLSALGRNNYRYDSSIPEGMDAAQDVGSADWPYTLDKGSPGDRDRAARYKKAPLSGVPGLWELPVYKISVPTDERCAQYGIAPGFRARLASRLPWFKVADGKIGGEDYTVMVTAGMSDAEILAAWKNTLDLRYAGNRAPMVMLLHADMYASTYKAAVPGIPDYRRRQRLIEDFVRYALGKPDVRIVPARAVLDWLEKPVPFRRKKKLQK